MAALIPDNFETVAPTEAEARLQAVAQLRQFVHSPGMIREIKNVTAPLKPWREQTLMGLALPPAGGAGFRHPSVIGSIRGVRPGNVNTRRSRCEVGWPCCCQSSLAF
jgi:hypothetical protein